MLKDDKIKALNSEIVGVFAFGFNKLWNKLIDKFLNPEKAVQKYSGSFVVVGEENTLHYRQSDFSISSIDHIVEYKYFLFMRAYKRGCFIKGAERAKAMILLKWNGNSNIAFTKINELVDLL